MKTLGLMVPLVLLLASCKPKEPPQSTAARSADAVAAPITDVLPEKVTFNEHIQPILSEYCYHCHGPDSGTREPKSEPLRLDIADKAFAARDGGSAVILKGNAADSILMKLIRSKDEKEVMPPPASHKKLTERDISLIERWIEQGAEYEAHWAFIPPQRFSTGPTENSIDQFVRERLKKEGLAPNPPEDPRRLYRRMHFDITGLPPSPEETERYLTSADQPAEIDRLLASPAASEHQARLWLDAARYADTHGIHIDNYRAIWPYRDWVVGAFAQNMPWDQFTIEQIAGDLLPSPSMEQLIATGFNRCLATTGEGGAIPDEYEAIYAKDRVETVSTVWLGLTTGCAACHDHKFDPISTADFYSMAAFFRNNTMRPMDGNNAEHPPNLFIPLLPDRPRWSALEGEIRGLEAELSKRKASAKPDFDSWLSKATIGGGEVIDPSLDIHLPLNSSEVLSNGIAGGKPTQWNIEGEHRDGPMGPALVASSSLLDLGDAGDISRDQKISFGLHIYIEGAPNGAVIARMDPANKHRGWDLWLEGGRIGGHFIDHWPDAANKLMAPTPLEPGKWHHVMMTFDGSQASHRAMTLYVDRQPVRKGPEPNSLGAALNSATSLRIGSRANGIDRLNGGSVAIQDFRFYRRVLSAREISALSQQNKLQQFLSVPPEQRTKEQTTALYDYYLNHHDEPTLELQKKLSTLTEERDDIRQRGSVTLIMEEKKDSPATTHILERGVYSSKGTVVAANVPASLPPIPSSGPYNRLDLAKWLVDRGNPLTARVTVNRAWQQFFGTGLVESSGDFGIMGARPTHPQLLDWLAVEFMDSGWDYRHLLKLILTSETYRQSATLSPEKLEKDPYNKLLARGPRQRLDAEVLRDLALSASGLLSPKSGGPPVKPYQPEGVWEAVAMKESNTRNYKEDSGESLYRRSLYTFWKRTAPPAAMEILNAPSREVSCIRRDQTNTPLQALVLLNDPQFVEASKQLAAHALKSATEPDARLDFITARLLNRPLDGEERKILRHSLEQALSSFTGDTKAATDLLNTGASPTDATLPAAELAAWTIIASQILNLDETVTR